MARVGVPCSSRGSRGWCSSPYVDECSPGMAPRAAWIHSPPAAIDPAKVQISTSLLVCYFDCQHMQWCAHHTHSDAVNTAPVSLHHLSTDPRDKIVPVLLLEAMTLPEGNFPHFIKKKLSFILFLCFVETLLVETEARPELETLQSSMWKHCFFL